MQIYLKLQGIFLNLTYSSTLLVLTFNAFAKWKAVESGAQHTCAITVEGEAFCWGSGTYGQLGNRTHKYSTLPVAVQAPLGVVFSKISCGGNHSCGITTDGVSYCWGSGNEGQLGDGQAKGSNIPVAVQVPPGIQFSEISAGYSHTCGLTSQGQIYCWGRGKQGQLGLQTTKDKIYIPTAVDQLTDKIFVNISSGYYHTCGVTLEGDIFCWGLGTHGQLGNKSYNSSNIPTLVYTSAKKIFAKVSAKEVHTCAVTLEGQGYCWGYNHFGQLGSGDFQSSNIPTEVQQSSDLTFNEISCGESSTCGNSVTGKTYCWGNGYYGQLGNGEDQDSEIPVEIKWPLSVVENSNLISFLKISSGKSHTCGLTSHGQIYCWGMGLNGQLGNQISSVSSNFPTAVMDMSGLAPAQALLQKLQNIPEYKGFSFSYNSSDVKQFIDLYTQRLNTDAFINQFNNDKEVIDISHRPEEYIKDNIASWSYTITDQNFADRLNLKTGVSYQAESLIPFQSEAIMARFYEAPPYPFVAQESKNVNLNPEFSYINNSEIKENKINEILKEIHQKIIHLPFPNEIHLQYSIYLDHRVGVIDNHYDRYILTQILLAIKTQDRDLFVGAMAELGTCFPVIHAEAKNAFLHTFSHLFVTGRFPSLGIKKTYYHLMLRCGQIFSSP